VPAEQVGGGQQAAFGGPGQEDLPGRALIEDLQVGHRARHGLRRSGAGRGHDGHAQAGRDEAADVGQVVALEDHGGAEPGPLAQLVGLPPQRRGRIQADERLGRHLGQPDLPPAGQPMVGQPMVARQGEAERLDRDQPGASRIIRRSPRAELEVGVPAVQDDEVRFVARLGEPEADTRVRGTEAAGQVGHEPGAQRLLEGQRHGAGVRVDELADGGDAVVEVVQ